MRSFSRRGFFTVLAGLGSATALVARSLSAAAVAGETALTTITPILHKRPSFDESGIEISRIVGTVRWFDVAKGYGFVMPDDGGPDILLHVTCLRLCGYQTVREGTHIIANALRRPKGLQIFHILEIDGTAVSSAAPLPARMHEKITPESGWEHATVKWFSRVRGFGFLTRGEGTEDVFVHIETLAQHGFTVLPPGQAVDIRWGRWSMGLMVADLRQHRPLSIGTIL